MSPRGRVNNAQIIDMANRLLGMEQQVGMVVNDLREQTEVIRDKTTKVDNELAAFRKQVESQGQQLVDETQLKNAAMQNAMRAIVNDAKREFDAERNEMSTVKAQMMELKNTIEQIMRAVQDDIKKFDDRVVNVERGEGGGGSWNKGE